MDEAERKLDFHALGLAIKETREKKGWTQAYLDELVGRTDRTIMSIENRGQFPSLNVFYQLVTLLEISSLFGKVSLLATIPLKYRENTTFSTFYSILVTEGT